MVTLLLPGTYMLLALIASIAAAAAHMFRLPDEVWSVAIGTAITALLTGALLGAILPTPEPPVAPAIYMEAAL